MSALSEFTGVGAIPAAPGGMPKVELKRKKKPRIVDAFLAVSPACGLSEEMPSSDSAQEPEPPTPAAAPALTAPPSPVPVPSAPVVATPETSVVSSTGESVRALMLTREVIEALSAGHSVNVRGILLEPMFKATSSAPKPVTEDMAARVQSTVASVMESTSPGAAPMTFASVDMNAPQPAPAAPSDGKAIMSAFRRFGG